MPASTLENTRIYAIGDIHGCYDLLKSLLDQIVANDLFLPFIKNKHLIFLGDYIDRGPSSGKVIDLLMHKLPDSYETCFLKGNHEAMMLDALEDQDGARFWLKNGGRETIASYGIKEALEDCDMANDELIDRFSEQLPQEHIRFLHHLDLSHENGDYFFAHAGIHPDRPLENQQECDLLWIRDRFLFSDVDFGKVVVHGHTPAKDVDIADNQIGIDTAAVYGGKLTALMLEGEQREFLYSGPLSSKTSS